jgi:2-oxoglutarate/2-oxoacid ferredoxin oxidoreductase subunit beta
MIADNPTSAPVALTRKDFQSDQQVKWCPGCGDYSILAGLQVVLPKLGVAKEDIAIISGIGCSSRFPYYMNTYGFHTIHGRACAVATGVKAANPKLSVWVITGDGDALSIGGNHTMHAMRRNIDIKILMFNNEIYGLTKGQFSPTSHVGLKTKTSPMGNIDLPAHPIALALGSGATFVARTADNDPKHLMATLEAAAAHRGTAFVEILQNCVIFNDGVHDDYYSTKNRKEALLYLEDGKPLVYANGTKAIVQSGFGTLASTDIAEGEEGKALVHNAAEPSGTLAYALSRFSHPEMPVPVGVFRCVEAPVYSDMMDAQITAAKEKRKPDLQKLLSGGVTWKI